MSEQDARPRLWSRDFVLAMTVAFFVGLVFYMTMTTLALYAIEQFAASEAAAGLAASMFIVGSTVARLFAGTLVDVAGRRRVLLICLAVFTVASGLYLVADTLALLFALRLVHGAAFGLATTATIAIGQSLIPPSRRGEGTGFFALSTTGSTALGPVLALTLVDRSGYPGLFVSLVTISVLATLTALVLREPGRRPRSRPNLRGLRPSHLVEVSALPVASFVLVLGIAFGGVMTFVDSFAQESGVPGGASAFFLSYAVVLAASRFVLGRVQDVKGDNVVVYPTLVAFAVGLALLAGASSTTQFVVAGAFAGVGYGTLLSASQTIVVAAVPPHRLGVAISSLFLMLDLGAGLGPLLLGWVAAAIGFGAMFGALAVLTVLTALIYHLGHGRTDHARRHRRPGPVPSS